MKVMQNLWFAKDMDAAVRFYVSLIPGSEVLAVSDLPADSPSGPGGSVKIMRFRLGDQSYTAFEAPPMATFNMSFSIVVECETQAEIDRLDAALSEGGTPQPCGWVQDRWGLSWQIQPRRMNELIGGPDRAAAKRVAEAMLKMRKLDLATLEAAAKG